MIFIDISKLNVPPKWIIEKQKKTQKLAKIAGDKQKSGFIRKNSHIWQCLKQEMEIVSYNKCWYCESKNVRGDLHVDHYRPKTTKGGYWWLAFDHSNFRLACSYCNSPHTGPDRVTRGKSRQFPLLDETRRASSPRSNIADEMPFLLDPTNPIDPPLLWFLDDGRSIPRNSKDSGFLYQKARTTINILNLNETKIVEERRKLWNECFDLVERGDRAYKHYDYGSPTGRIEYEAVIQKIREFIHPSSQFSATACACFRGSSLDWVRDTVPF